MRLTGKRFWLLPFMVLVSTCLAFTQVIFSVEEISVAEFEQAENSSQKYTYSFFSDSVPENNITRQIVADARRRFERLDSFEKNCYDIPCDGAEYESIFQPSSLTYSKKLGIYGFMLPSIHEGELYCYNAQTGKYIGDMILPFAVSPNGIMVAQKGYDCDVPLDLHFYSFIHDRIYRRFSIFYSDICGDAVVDYYTSKELGLPVTSFFVGDKLLYISLYQYNSQNDTSLIYLKITLPDI